MGTFTYCWYEYELRTVFESNLTICGEIANAYNPQPSNKLQDKFPREKSRTGSGVGRERGRGVREGGEEKGGEMDIDMEREMEMDIH